MISHVLNCKTVPWMKYADDEQTPRLTCIFMGFIWVFIVGIYSIYHEYLDTLKKFEQLQFTSCS